MGARGSPAPSTNIPGSHTTTHADGHKPSPPASPSDAVTIITHADGHKPSAPASPSAAATTTTHTDDHKPSVPASPNDAATNHAHCTYDRPSTTVSHVIPQYLHLQNHPDASTPRGQHTGYSQTLQRYLHPWPGLVSSLTDTVIRQKTFLQILRNQH